MGVGGSYSCWIERSSTEFSRCSVSVCLVTKFVYLLSTTLQIPFQSVLLSSQAVCTCLSRNFQDKVPPWIL